ncbi:MAG: hypothetical protein NWF04_05645 [Candidatus Bathyarchaeota archaeon]|nr:hypothetical protein [Candidatus Bathyarchaeota archaeon]
MDKFKPLVVDCGFVQACFAPTAIGVEIVYNREFHKATCADCGKECEVPFKPDGTRPVYCRECYAKRRPPRRY